MKILRIKNLEDLNSYIENVEESAEYESLRIKSDKLGEDIIETAGPAVYIESLGLLIIEGTYCIFRDGKYEPDRSVTLIYKWNCEDDEFNENTAGNFDSIEQDSPMIALYNYGRS